MDKNWIGLGIEFLMFIVIYDIWEFSYDGIKGSFDVCVDLYFY